MIPATPQATPTPIFTSFGAAGRDLRAAAVGTVDVVSEAAVVADAAVVAAVVVVVVVVVGRHLFPHLGCDAFGKIDPNEKLLGSNVISSTHQELRSPLNCNAPSNMYCISSTFPVFQFEISTLNARAPENISVISTTADVSQPEIELLKL